MILIELFFNAQFILDSTDYLKLINFLCKAKSINSDAYINQALYNWLLIRETLLSGLLTLGMLDDNIENQHIDANKIIKEALK